MFKETYIKDVIERKNIRNKTEFEQLLDIMASNIGYLTSMKKLANSFKSIANNSISEPTLSQYLEYISEAFLVNKVQRYDIKGKKYLESPFKYYFVDQGLCNTRLNFRQTEINHIMENIIYNELIIRGYQVDIGNVRVREKDNDQYVRKQLEVDFVANLGSKRYYIQSVQEIPTQEKEEQEERSLLEIKDSFRKVIIIGKDIVPKHDENGITILGMKDFLLNMDSLDF